MRHIVLAEKILRYPVISVNAEVPALRIAKDPIDINRII